MSLTGKRALVTGGGTGIGRQICLRLAAAGVEVALCGRHPATIKAVADEVRAFNVRALPWQADVSDAASVERLREQVEDAFGGIDILVNNAAQFGGGPVASMSIDDFDRICGASSWSPEPSWRACRRGRRAALS